MNGETIARALGLRRAGAGKWHGKCPACSYRAGFTVTERLDGLPLLYCHAGRCEQADLIAALRRGGLWPEQRGPENRVTAWRQASFTAAAVSPVAGEHAAAAADSERREQALAIWRRSRPAPGTLAETYLRARGYTGPIPPILRFAIGRHPSDPERWHPMVVAAVLRDGCIVAVHRTFLRADGAGKADLAPNKKTLGPCKGAAVPLAPAARALAITEGIENALSYMQVIGTATWAALSAGGIRSLILPSDVEQVVIAADPDPVGMIAARAAARRWLHEGRHVAIARPPLGVDFNDLARAASL